MKKHILLITQYFYPESFRINDIACEWVKRGYKVTVLTGIPNYPMGKFYEGYSKKSRTREVWNGVKIIRIPLIPRGNSGNKILNAAGMIANYFSFLRSGYKWVKSKEAADINPNLVFTYEVSPMTQALIGVWYAKKYKIPSYLYVQDLWPENVEMVTGIKSSLVIGPINRMVDKIYRETDTIFTTSQSFVEAIVNRKKRVNRNKVHYWPQYAEDFYVPMEPQEQYEKELGNNSFKIAFTGNIGTAQGLDVLPKAAQILKDENVEFIIVGDGRYQTEFQNQIDKLNVRNKFTFIRRVQAEEIPIILSRCQAAFISFTNISFWDKTIPAKLQSYMACGKPIIASASGETKKIIAEASCGICSQIGDPASLAEGIREMMTMNLSELQKNSRLYFENHFNKKMLMDQMDEYFNN
ncbi:glycosyltransferase family 4 protein [Ileibacterium valens]|uniref:glycosyltransferase family 4 protein n=1 Tax=Ileibacterium valens TaxID=1862668 RepID=UPI00272A70D3|nr:glycosyltransferase family 4 protein [Ileibacterium valens]